MKGNGMPDLLESRHTDTEVHTHRHTCAHSDNVTVCRTRKTVEIPLI